ncbi:MAG: ATP-binding cassette domain-containing protein [Amphiplicatus sp.]|nr:ATP-binding cassette domain-containing protein [Amphiplicatus sp.]
MRSIVREFATELFNSERNRGDFLPAPALTRSTYVASAIINLLALALPLTILQVYDRVLPNAAYETLTALVLLLGAAIVIDGLLKYFRSMVVNWTAASYTHNLSTRALSSMLAAKPSTFGKTTASEHLERLNAINGLGNHYSAQSRTVMVDILFVPVFSCVIILIGGLVFSAVVALFAIFGYLAMKGTRSLNEIIAERENYDARKQDFVIEVLRAIQTVKACAMEPLMLRRYERLQSSASVITKKMITLTGTAQTYNNAYAALSTIVIVSTGALLVLNGRLTLGALACCMLLSSQLLQPLMRSLTSWNEIKLAQHRRDRVNAIFENGEAQALPRQRMAERFSPKSISLKNVTIQYGDGDPIFKNLSLDIEAGSFVALKGEDGSGRSTLLRALVQDAPVVEGEIAIDGKVATPDAPNTLRRHVRYVGLNPVIFRGTILDNITLFGEIPAKIALSAAKFTGLDEEVTRMPLGYDTLLKSSASKDIPTPTAQRVTLTRVLAMRPSVLVLDEANTLLDMAGEQRFLEALKRVHGKVTVIIASHRPSLLRLADKVYELENGGLKLVTQNEPQHNQAAS